MKLFKFHRAFTMMEALVVMMLVAITAAITIPIYVMYLDKSRLKSASEGFFQQFEKARSEALQSKQTVRVVFQAGSSWCYGATTATNCDCSVTANCALGQTTSSSFSGVALSMSGFSSNMTFAGSSGDASTAGSVSFANSEGTITIEFNRGGRIKICSSNVEGYSAC